MLEIEMKFPIGDFIALEDKLLQEHATFITERKEIDHYLNAPDRNFAHTDEALRLRCIGSCNILTYKGPKQDQETKTRKEIEVNLQDGAQEAERMLPLLDSLGYQQVARVEKNRKIYSFPTTGFYLEICLDHVAEVGDFVELEIQAEIEDYQSAKNTLSEVAQHLGLHGSERRSYLELLLEGEARK